MRKKLYLANPYGFSKQTKSLLNEFINIFNGLNIEVYEPFERTKQIMKKKDNWAYDLAESNFYEWDAKNIGNLSFYFDDDYKFNFGSNNSINLGWILDLRKMVTTKDQDFEVNNTGATYKQDDDLTEEVSLAANIGYEKKISDQHFLKFNLDSTTSTQELTSFSGNFSYKFTF